MSQVKLLDKNDATKRCGLGCIAVESGAKRMKLPLKSVDVTGRVAERLAHVTVTETFTNPYSEHLEAVYIFPLSGGCTVSSFELKVGDRVIKGIVEERAAARAQYAEALQTGKRAALLEQERDDVFTVQVGNLPPGEEVTVVITYSEKLAYFEDGTTEIRLPLVVAPRYIPGNILDRDSVGDGVELDTDMVPDASRISPPRFAKGVDPKIALNLKVVLSADDTIEDLACSQHVTKMGTSKDGITVSLSREDELLDRDFVLRWRVATDKVQSKFLIYRNPQAKDQCYGMLSLVPPKNTDIASAPRDIVFVVDRSGSMNGLKMVSAARACSYLLSTLTPKDKFAIEAFDTNFEWMPTGGSNDKFLEADEAGIQEGMKYLRTIAARGGTSLDVALTLAIEAMKQRLKSAGRQPVIVVLTDGEVGNESNILANIQRTLGDLRVFTIGIDTAVNDGFLRKLAALGGGTATFVEPGTQLESALGQVSREIGTPLIQAISIEDITSGIDLASIAPKTIPDLFEGRAVSSFFTLAPGAMKDLSKVKLRVKGTYADGSLFEEEISGQTTDVSALSQLWAKACVVDLEDEFRSTSQPGQQAKLQIKIVEIAKRHSILTKFTAFVVVDQSEIVNADGSIRKVVQPVQNPALWADQVNPEQLSVRQSAMFQAQPQSQAYGSPGFASAGNAWGAPAPSSMGASAGMPRMPQSPPPSFSDEQMRRQGPSGVGKPGSPPQDAMEAIFGSAPQRPQSAPPAPSNDAPLTLSQSIKRKISGSGGFQDATSSVGSSPLPNDIVGVKEALERLAKVLNECFAKIKIGEVPDHEALENARTDLIAALSKSAVATSVPALQKYLRSDLVKLIAAIAGAGAINKQLQSLSALQQKEFETLQLESVALLDSSGEKPFWTATV